MASASGPLTRSSTEVRRSISRTSGDWRSSTSAIRYPATVRSLPENSRTKRSGSGCSASEIAASRRPAAHPSVRSCSSAEPLGGQLDPGSLQQLTRLVEREAQIRVAQLVKIAREPQPMQPEPGLLPRGEHQRQPRRQPGDEPLEPRLRIGRAELVQVVDHEHDRLVQRPQLRQQPLHHHLALKGGRRADALHEPRAAHGTGERLDDRQPEPLRVALPALDGRPRHAAPADGIGPRAQERGLAAARRRAHHDDAARTGVRQEMEQRVAPDQPAFAGSTLRPGAARGWRSIHRASRVLPAGASQERRVPIARTA